MEQLWIHKYNKQNPSYTEEWTDFHDIGKMFSGKILTYSDYIETEEKYVQVIKKILDCLQITKMTVLMSEKRYSLRTIQNRTLLNEHQSLLFQKITPGLIVTTDEIIDIIRMNLRDSLYCQLSSPKLFLSISLNSYLYTRFNHGITKSIIETIVANEGLFVETVSNYPFLLDDEDQQAYYYNWGEGQITTFPDDNHHDLRISKDNPYNRTYTEWSNFDEIEDNLTLKNYQHVEHKYISLILEFLDFFKITEITLSNVYKLSSEELRISPRLFSIQEEELFQQLDIEGENIIISKSQFQIFFQLLLKNRINAWISADQTDIQFDFSYHLYLSFYGYSQEIKELVEKHGLYWQERQPPYHEAVDFT